MGLFNSKETNFKILLAFEYVIPKVDISGSVDLGLGNLRAAHIIFTFCPKTKKTWQDVVKLEVLYNESYSQNIPIQNNSDILLVACSAYRVNFANGIKNSEVLGEDRINYLLVSAGVDLRFSCETKRSLEDNKMLRSLASFMIEHKSCIVGIDSRANGGIGISHTLPFAS